MSDHHALCRCVGSGIPFSLGTGADAVTVLLRPMRLVDWGVLEQLLLLRRKKQLVLETLPPDVRDLLKEQIKEDRSFSMTELISYASTAEGATWRLWLALRREYPHCQCIEWVDNLVKEKRLEEYLTVSLQADGLDIFADLDWPRMPHADIIASLKGPGKQASVDWKVHTNSVAETYGVGPQDFGELTYYQARLLLWDREMLAGKFTLSAQEQKSLSEILRMRKLYEQQQAAPQNASFE